MLNAYLTATRQLLQNPSAPIALYADADLVSYINTARQQLAGESASIKDFGTLSVSGTPQTGYLFSAVTLAGAGAGVASVINVRMARAGAGHPITPRSWPWYAQYNLSNLAATGPLPLEWAQYGEGTHGALFFFPGTIAPVTVGVDADCLPVDLVDDTTPEAIPALWTSAVPYYAAYQALLAAQTGARVQDAERLFQIYERFVARARAAATPDVVPVQYPMTGRGQPEARR